MTKPVKKFQNQQMKKKKKKCITIYMKICEILRLMRTYQHIIFLNLIKLILKRGGSHPCDKSWFHI